MVLASIILFPIPVFFLKRVLKSNGMLFFITFLGFVVVILFRDTINQVYWNNCAIITNLAVGLFSYTCGYIYNYDNQIKNYLVTGKYSFEVFLVSIFVLFESKYYWNYSLDLRTGTVSNTAWVFLLFPSGIVFLIYFSHLIVEKGVAIKKILKFIGKRSMSIMLFHILCFNIVTLAGIYLIHDTYEPSWTNAFHGTWYTYANASIGLTVPLIVDLLIEVLKKKTHIINPN